MKIKVLFLDDIFSGAFRQTLDNEQLAFDDMWVQSIEKEFSQSKDIGVDFEIIKSGDIDAWRTLIESEKPDLVLLDLYWHEQAKKKFGSVRKAADISLDVLKEIRKTHANLPVIQYTLRPDKEIMERSYAAGATFFLEKVPLAVSEVHSALKYIMIYLMRRG
ncbi:MAG: response regulator [Desulfobacterales bacterium]|jgi:DNA-binding NarL/FixJ family response regulator|nr:response regulator [Desulfobacterales bacterium]